MLDGRRTAPVDGSLVSLDHEELHRVLQERDAQMRAAGTGCDQGLKAFGVEEIHAVIAAERPAFDLESVVVLARIAFLGVGDERLRPLGEFAVGA